MVYLDFDGGLHMQQKNYAIKNMVIGIALGCLAGGLVALFAAPQSGTRTRQFVQEKGGEVIDKSTDSIQRARNQVAGAITSTRQRAGLSVVRLGNQIGSQLLGIKD
jgi:gas vesicle protein